MYAVEFRAAVRNGTIEIPPQYRDRLKEVVRVILLDEAPEATDNLIDRLLETPLHIEGFEPLALDEIYARA